MRPARISLLLCVGWLFGCCPGTAAAEPSGRVASGLSDAEDQEALVHRLITSDPRDWCAFSACPPPLPEPSGIVADSYEAYAYKVVAADRSQERVGVSIYGWLGVKKFQQLVDASAKNPAFCIRLLSDKNYSENQKGVALLSMYTLSTDQRVVFVRSLMTLYDQGLISSEDIWQGFEPRLSIATLYEHYQDKNVKSLLKEMEARANIPAMNGNGSDISVLERRLRI